MISNEFCFIVCIAAYAHRAVLLAHPTKYTSIWSYSYIDAAIKGRISIFLFQQHILIITTIDFNAWFSKEIINK